MNVPKDSNLPLNFGESRVSGPWSGRGSRFPLVHPRRASLRVFWILCSRMRTQLFSMLMEPEQDIILVSDDEVSTVIAARWKQNRRKRRMAAASDAIRNICHQQNIIEVSSDDEAPVFHILSNIRIGPPPRRNEIRCNAQASYIT